MTKKTLLFTQFMREGIQIQVVNLWESTCQPTNSWNLGLLPLNLPPLYNKKMVHSLLLTLLWFFGFTHQLSNTRGCHVIRIWFNGSIRTSFTESYKIKQCLPHCPIRAPIFVYYSWAASYMRQPIYVGFSKTGSDTTIEPNFDERTASDETWKMFQSFRRCIS